jgi:hypothetical protein
VPFDPIKKQELRVKNGHRVPVKLLLCTCTLPGKKKPRFNPELKTNIQLWEKRRSYQTPLKQFKKEFEVQLSLNIREL